MGAAMSSRVIRLGILAIFGIVLVGAMAAAQDRSRIELAAAGGVAVFNPVEGRMVVTIAMPDGSRAQSGDVVCEFDPAELRDRVTSQEFVVSGAQAEVQGTRIAREVAFLALREYKDGAFRQQLASTEGQIKLTESKLSSAEDHVDWSRRMFVKGYVSLAEKVSGELALKHARFALEEAQSQKVSLVDFSKEKTIKTLTGAIELARARELAAQAALERERSLRKKLVDQIGRCKVKAPSAGRVKYEVPISAGAVVHDGQLIFRVVVDAKATPKAE
jgi:HlyD family secretion protein